MDIVIIFFWVINGSYILLCLFFVLLIFVGKRGVQKVMLQMHAWFFKIEARLAHRFLEAVEKHLVAIKNIIETICPCNDCKDHLTQNDVTVIR